MENETNTYEMGYLLSPLVPEEKIDDEVVILRKKIEDKRGLIISEGRPAIRPLSYPIKKHNTAYFGWIKFMMEPESLFSFKKEVEGPAFLEKSNIIRFLIVKVKKESTQKISSKKTLPKQAPIKKEKRGLRDEELSREIDKKIDELLEKEAVEASAA